MKRFLRNILWFVLPVLAMAAGAEAWLRSLPSSYKIKQQLIEDAPRRATFIFGDSHAFYGIRPDAVPSSAYNLANVSQTFDYDLTLIKRVVDSAQAIVLTVDQSNLFNTPLQESSEWYRCRYYNLYMHCQTPSYKPGYLLEIAGGEVTRKKAESYLHHEPLGCDSLGWHNTCEPITGYNRHLSDSAAMVHTINHRLRDAQDFSHNVSVLKEIVTLCAAKGTKLIVVSMPLSSAYRRHASATQVAMLRQTAEELVSAGAIYHDYGDDPRFTDADFHDSDHLDREGARRFTQILCDELLY